MLGDELVCCSWDGRRRLDGGTWINTLHQVSCHISHFCKDTQQLASTKKCTMQRLTGLLVKCTKRFVVFIDNDAPFIHKHYPLKVMAREIDGGQFPGMSRYDDWPMRGLYEGLGGYLDSASIASVLAWEVVGRTNGTHCCFVIITSQLQFRSLNGFIQSNEQHRRASFLKQKLRGHEKMPQGWWC